MRIIVKKIKIKIILLVLNLNNNILKIIRYKKILIIGLIIVINK